MKAVIASLLIATATLSGCVVTPAHDYRGGYGYRDRDHNGIPNRYDRDRDGDGVANRRDRFPDNPRRY